MGCEGFEWDKDKNRENPLKHGVSFELAQYVFDDPKRIIIGDRSHGGSELRFYCIGLVGAGILTVRFTLRDGMIRIFGAGLWRKGRRIYEEKNSIHG
jgi:uncharacterized DUF497 family protein